MTDRLTPFRRDLVTGQPRPDMAPCGDAAHSDKVHGVGIALFYATRPIWPTRELATNTMAHPINMKKVFMPVLPRGDQNFPIAQARNAVCKEAIKQGLKYLFMLDDDVCPIPETVTNLVYELEQNPEVGAISAVYCTKEDLPVPVFSAGDGEGPFWDWQFGDIIKGHDGKGVRYVGAGALLIRLSALAKVEEPWFKLDMTNEGAISEDFYFTRKMCESGQPVWVHGGIVLAHLGKDGRPYILRPDSRPMRGIPREEIQASVGIPTGNDKVDTQATQVKEAGA